MAASRTPFHGLAWENMGQGGRNETAVLGFHSSICARLVGANRTTGLVGVLSYMRHDWSFGANHFGLGVGITAKVVIGDPSGS